MGSASAELSLVRRLLSLVATVAAVPYPGTGAAGPSYAQIRYQLTPIDVIAGTLNHLVEGSSPSRLTITTMGARRASPGSL